MKNGLVRSAPKARSNQERWQKNFQRERGATKLYQYHFENPGGPTLPTPMILTPLSPQLGHFL